MGQEVVVDNFVVFSSPVLTQTVCVLATLASGGRGHGSIIPRAIGRAGCEDKSQFGLLAYTSSYLRFPGMGKIGDRKEM